MDVNTRTLPAETRRGSRDALVPAFTLALAALVAGALFAMAKSLTGSETWGAPAGWLWVLLPVAAAFFGCLLLGGSRLPILNESRPAALAVGYVVALMICAAAIYVSQQNGERRKHREDRAGVEDRLRQLASD